MTEDQEARVVALEAQLAEQKKELEALKAAAEPKEPFVAQPFERFDPTARASMSPTMMAELATAVPDGLVREVVGDFRVQAKLPSAPSAAPPAKSTGGWTDAAPLRPPPGVELIDRMVDEQDRRDKVELAQRILGGKP